MISLWSIILKSGAFYKQNTRLACFSLAQLRRRFVDVRFCPERSLQARVRNSAIWPSKTEVPAVVVGLENDILPLLHLFECI